MDEKFIDISNLSFLFLRCFFVFNSYIYFSSLLSMESVFDL